MILSGHGSTRRRLRAPSRAPAETLTGSSAVNVWDELHDEAVAAAHLLALPHSLVPASAQS